MGISISMNCPACGGTLSLEEGERTISCPYCTSLLAIEGDQGVQHIMFTDNVDHDKAVATVKKWMGSGFKARDLSAKGEITECYPIYVPFWKLKTMAAGWVCGYRVVQHEKRTERVPMEELVDRSMNWNQVACDVGDIGVEHIKDLNGTALLHAEGIIPTFEVTTSSTDAMNRGMDTVRKKAIDSANVPHITFSKMHVFPLGMTLVFYPIWIVRYKYSGRMYFATVDGVRNEVLSGRAPGDSLWRSIAMTLGMAIGGFGTGAILSAGAMSNLPGEVIAIVIVVCLVIAGGAYYFFRMGGEMTTGDVKGGYNMSNMLGESGSIEDLGAKKVFDLVWGR
jgi:hypothetical protein